MLLAVAVVGICRRKKQYAFNADFSTELRGSLAEHGGVWMRRSKKGKEDMGGLPFVSFSSHFHQLGPKTETPTREREA